MAPTPTDTDQIAWDLEPLVDGAGEAGVRRMLDAALERASAFAERHAGRVAAMDGATLVEAMRELGEISDLVGRAGSYAMLRFSTDTTDPARGALLQEVQERGAQLQTRTLFFELEWAALDDERAAELLATDGLDFCRHHLETQRALRPYLLTEPEERILTEKDVTGSTAWARLFNELTSAITVTVGDEEPVPLEIALSNLQSPDRDLRRRTAEGISAGLEPGLRTRAYIYNTLLQDKATDDRLRSFPTWLSARNLSNEASDESVQALLSAVRARYDLPQRWYRLKAQLLGLDRLADYDRMAAVTDADEQMGWSEAQQLVLESFDSFSPDMANLARRFFDERWIDAPIRPGKRPGAFCAYVTPSAHPYVMLNWTARRRDALTLAHELGHGLHAALASEQGIFHHGTPLTLAETASVFGEEVVFARLLEEAPTAESRLDLLASAIEGSIATVFRQTAMCLFEDAVHTRRREQGELSVTDFGDAWAAMQGELLGDAVEITDGYRSWWSYVPHFIQTPGYVYAYAYGQLLALAVYRRYEQEGASFVPDYLAMLSAGGSMSPQDLGRSVGIDLADPDFWDSGIDIIEQQLDKAEAAAREAGRI